MSVPTPPPAIVVSRPASQSPAALSSFFSPLTSQVNSFFAGKQPYQVSRDTLLVTLAVYLAAHSAYRISRVGVKKYVLGLGLAVAKQLPFTRAVLESEKAATINKLESSVISAEVAKEVRHTQLPTAGTPHDQLLDTLVRWADKEKSNWVDGQASGTVYHGGDELVALESKVFGLFCLSNPLHPDIFCYVRKMEAEVVAMTTSLFHGTAETCGSMTSGGTESILMAMKAYRDRHHSLYPDTVAEIICSSTAHAAFAKAAHYFGMKLVVLQVDKDTYVMRVSDVKRAVTRDTCVLVASAPAFPHGVMDDIAGLSDLAQSLHLPLHVDCCLGSFLLPFVSSAGYPVPPFDFALPGVTSISCDTHKYGYAVKGSSVIMYRSPSYRHYQYFVAADWSGGIYASPTMPGSRPGGLIAATWAALMATGEQGYREAAKEIMDTAKEIERGIRGIDGLTVLGQPCMSVIAFASTSSSLNIYAVNECLHSRHWLLNTLQNPSAVHLCVTYVHRGRAAQFVDDVRAAVAEVRADPQRWSKGSAAIYGMAASIPDMTIVDDLAKGYIDALYKA